MSDRADSLDEIDDLPEDQVGSEPVAAAAKRVRNDAWRSSKIGKLPVDMRDAINKMLDCGDSPMEIARQMAGAQQGIDATHVRRWMRTGYKEHCKRKAAGIDPSQAARMIDQGEAYKVHELNMFTAAHQINSVIAQIDISHVLEAAKTSPRYYLALLKQATQLLRPAIDAEKFREHVKERKKAIEGQLAAAKAVGGISEEALARIERELRLL